MNRNLLTQADLSRAISKFMKATKGSGNKIDKIYRQACKLIKGGKVSTGPGSVGCKYVNGMWI